MHHYKTKYVNLITENFLAVLVTVWPEQKMLNSLFKNKIKVLKRKKELNILKICNCLKFLYENNFYLTTNSSWISKNLNISYSGNDFH